MIQFTIKQGLPAAAAAAKAIHRFRRHCGLPNQITSAPSRKAGGTSINPRYFIPAAIPNESPASKKAPQLFRRVAITNHITPPSSMAPVIRSVFDTEALRNTTPANTSSNPAASASILRKPAASAPAASVIHASPRK